MVNNQRINNQNQTSWDKTHCKIEHTRIGNVTIFFCKFCVGSKYHVIQYVSWKHYERDGNEEGGE